MILFSLPLVLLQQIVLALRVGAATEIWLSQVVAKALADFHVVQETRSVRLVGLPSLLLLCGSKGASWLITDQVAIAGVLCQKSLLLLGRELILLRLCLLLKLELVVFVLAAVRLHDVVNVVDLGMVHLVVRLGLLHALADLQGRPAVPSDIVAVD